MTKLVKENSVLTSVMLRLQLEIQNSCDVAKADLFKLITAKNKNRKIYRMTFTFFLSKSEIRKRFNV